MTINEKNLATWIKANGGAAPNKQALQMARSMECHPEYKGGNVWQTPSTTKTGIVWTQEVFFSGMDREVMLSIGLNIVCDCYANKKCIHILAVERKYHSNWKYYFHLFGLSPGCRLGELHSRASQIAALMNAAPVEETCEEYFFRAGEIDRHFQEVA